MLCEGLVITETHNRNESISIELKEKYRTEERDLLPMQRMSRVAGSLAGRQVQTRYTKSHAKRRARLALDVHGAKS